MYYGQLVWTKRGRIWWTCLVRREGAHKVLLEVKHNGHQIVRDTAMVRTQPPERGPIR